MARSHRRVAIERIAGDAARQVSFSKRRQGLFKKVCELSTLCGAESAVLVHSPAGRVYSLGDPDVITIVDRFLEYASQSDAAAASGTSSQQQEGGGRRRPQQPRRGAAPQEVRRRVVEEELYRQLADQDSWCEEAKVYRSVLAADMKDKEERLLPQRWAAKVQELSLQESEEMADALEELALRIGDWIREKEEEEGVPPAQRWSPDDPAPPPTNPWRQAAFLASLGAHAAPWGAAANLAPMAGGINVPYAAPPAMRAPAAAPAPLNLAMSAAIAAPEAPPMGAAMLPVTENPVAPGFMAARFPGMGGPTGATVSADPYGFVASSSSAAHPVTAQLMHARRDGGGSSTGLGPGSMFY